MRAFQMLSTGNVGQPAIRGPADAAGVLVGVGVAGIWVGVAVAGAPVGVAVAGAWVGVLVGRRRASKLETSLRGAADVPVAPSNNAAMLVPTTMPVNARVEWICILVVAFGMIAAGSLYASLATNCVSIRALNATEQLRLVCRELRTPGAFRQVLSSDSPMIPVKNALERNARGRVKFVTGVVRHR
jgi:hypothetical protein